MSDLGFTRSWSLGVLHCWKPCTLLMILTAYIDESGTHSPCPFTVMAGYVGDARKWARFDKRWAKLLGKHGLTHFHATDVVGGGGPFKGWSADRRRNLVDHIDNIVHDYPLFGFSSVLRDDDYDRFYIAGHRPKKLQLDSKYGLLFRCCLSHVTETLLRQDDLPRPLELHVIMEDGHKNRGDVERLTDIIRKNAPPQVSAMVRTVTFAEKKRTPGLQAADFLAYPSLHMELGKRVEVTADDVEGIRDIVAHRCPVFRLPVYRPTLEGLKQAALECNALSRWPIGD